MKVAPCTFGEGHSFTASVDKDELTCDGGKKLPYPTTIGVFGVRRGKVFIDVWMPAGYTPRGYRAAADRKLRNLAWDRFGAEPGYKPTKMR